MEHLLSLAASLSVHGPPSLLPAHWLGPRAAAQLGGAPLPPPLPSPLLPFALLRPTPHHRCPPAPVSLPHSLLPFPLPALECFHFRIRADAPHLASRYSFGDPQLSSHSYFTLLSTFLTPPVLLAFTRAFIAGTIRREGACTRGASSQCASKLERATLLGLHLRIPTMPSLGLPLAALLIALERVCGSGVLELELLRYANPQGKNAAGLCCEGLADAQLRFLHPS